MQEEFDYGQLFMLVMIGYIFMFKMVKELQDSGLEIVAGLTPPITLISKDTLFLLYWGGFLNFKRYS